MRPILIRNGYVITGDPAIGDVPSGDVLIVNGRIAEIGQNLHHDEAEEIDATGTIVMPGMVDTHRHTWQTQLRAICADMSLMRTPGIKGATDRPVAPD